VSVFLVNRRTGTPGPKADESWLFQVWLELASGDPAFLARPDPLRGLADPELRSFELLYRNRHVFALGHGSATDWSDVDLETGREHLRRCRSVADHIRDGIRVIETDAFARRAFAFANRAMLLQRSRTDWLSIPVGERPDHPALTGTWRPFQVAFMLMNLRGV